MLFTAEGKKVDTKSPLPDYPTPQFRRDSFFSLNGVWDFAITKSADFPVVYDKTIVVPFAVETPLSGVFSKVGKDDFLHYKLEFSAPSEFCNSRVLLHFEAVDQVCDVFLNGVKIGHHEGGYLPFALDAIGLVSGKNVLQVVVTDDTDSEIFPRGKQMNKRGGIWYTPTSGIWQSVWMERIPNEAIKAIRITPEFDEKTVSVEVKFDGQIKFSSVVAYAEGEVVAVGNVDGRGSCLLKLDNSFHPWCPEDPFLYDLDIKINEDVVHSYFAMRKCSSFELHGHKVFALNNKPLFLSGVLDQGYYPDGGLTQPSDQAMINDIKMVKDLGFNMIRKHIKIEPMRWYYHCDKMGMLVMQDFVSGGAPYKFLYIALRPFLNFNFDDTEPNVMKKLGRGNKDSRSRFFADMSGTIDHLYNCPCIYSWTIFNEGWGQFETQKCLTVCRVMDNTRLFDANSGWYDQEIGDYCSRHIYFKKAKMKNDGKRILYLSEFGGYALGLRGHTFSAKKFGYKGYKNKEALNEGIKNLYEKQIVPLIKEGLSMTVYTQLSDVEDELNGLVTYDREVVKVDPSVMKEINTKLKFED